MISLQFFTLVAPFKFAHVEQVPTMADALEAARKYAEPAGYTNIGLVDDDDFGTFRITGKTPGGRSGRNIAQGDDLSVEGDDLGKFDR